MCRVVSTLGNSFESLTSVGLSSRSSHCCSFVAMPVAWPQNYGSGEPVSPVRGNRLGIHAIAPSRVCKDPSLHHLSSRSPPQGGLAAVPEQGVGGPCSLAGCSEVRCLQRRQSLETESWCKPPWAASLWRGAPHYQPDRRKHGQILLMVKREVRQ